WPCPANVNLKQVTIGKPIQNIQLYILNAQNQLQPKGVVGELHIAGVGLARGYHNQPQLTAERFVDNPFATKPGDRLYKTGDLARYLGDGNIEYMGRMDDQVKIRGLRIELGEIEHQLTALQGIKSAVVLAREDQPGQQQLVAYIIIVPGADIKHTLREQLHIMLPEHMVPHLFVEMDEFPVTNNGKTDKKALPSPNPIDLQGQYCAPKTPTEVKLTQIWAELLNLGADKLSANAHFFEVGGHSLLSVRLVGEVRSLMGIELAIRDVFDHPKLSSMALLIDSSAGKKARPAVVALTRTSNQLPASFAHARLWFIDQMDGTSSQYNMPGSFRFTG
ncbi:MAG: AMP-binding protein, partial [Psychrosphaera sp.]|nr:AMP-binding protein [Psychrosphaera sp.]